MGCLACPDFDELAVAAYDVRAHLGANRPHTPGRYGLPSTMPTLMVMT
jgi:hypothetical protein